MKRFYIGVLILLTLNTLSAQELHIKAVGDVMLGSRTPSPVLPANNGAAFKDSLGDVLKNADITFGNLEGVFVKKGIPPRKCSEASRKAGRCYEFGMPSNLAQVLKDVGFNVMSQDNNHVNDYGYAGIKFTKKLLDSFDIKCISKKSYVEFTVQEKKIAFVAFGHSGESYQVFDLVTTKAVISKLNASHDLVIVSFHGGAEGTSATHVYNKTETFYRENRGNLIKFSHTAIDAGADLIIGHGPHVLRGMELYKNKLICYSLGNFLTHGNVSLRGIKGHGAIADLKIDLATGDFKSGRIISTKQKGRGFPVVDSTHAGAKEIKALSTADFPNSPLQISNDGTLTIKK